jgi:hypothetical protein
MSRAEKIMSRLLLAVQLLVITLGLTFVIFHSIQFVASSMALLEYFGGQI